MALTVTDPTGPFRANVPNLALLRAFEAFGRTGGIRRAAALLGVDHSAVSRHLKALETFVGAGLIDRNSSSGLTEAGQRYYAVVSQSLSLIDAETSHFRQVRRDKLTLWCIPGLAFQWMLPRLRDFTDAQPDILIELRPSDSPPDPRNSEVDGDVRYVHHDAVPNGPHFRTLELARPPVFPVCTPAYLAGIGRIAAAEDLRRTRLLHEENDLEWRTWFAGQGVTLPQADLPGPRLWHAHLVLDECRNGRGVALANAFLLGEDLASGRLVRLDGGGLPFKDVTLGAYVLAMRQERWSDRPVAMFRLWLSDAMASAVRGDV